LHCKLVALVRQMADEGAASLRFTISREGSTNGAAAPKTFTLEVGAETPIRIGRAPGNDVIVESRGVSQYHAELRLVQNPGESAPTLCVRDLSMNGTGLRRPDGKAPFHLDKRADVGVPDGSVLLVPMLLKVSQSTDDRGWLRVDLGEQVGGAEAPRRAAAPAAAEPAAAAAGVSEAGEADIEQCRMRFVELLLKTREVSAGTSYEEARKLLADSTDWNAVDESTRKECFEIFVEHLGSHSQKKKDKKKSKDKDKEKSKKHKRNEDDEAPARRGRSPESRGAAGGEEKRRDRRGASGSGSGDRKRKREKRGSRRSRSGSPGGSAPRGGKRRHRSP